jgi:hypothetical protein
MVREIKKMTVVFNPILGFFDLVFKDGAVKTLGFLVMREVGCPHPY